MVLPTVVLVPGAWHTPAYYEPVAGLLRCFGYNTRSVALPSAVVEGATPPEDHRADIFAIRGVVEEALNAGSDVVVVPHSYGGVPTTGALVGLDRHSRTAAGHQTAVIAIAAIASFILPKGKDIASGQGLPSGERLEQYSISGPLNHFQKELDPANIFYHDLPAEDAEHWVAELKPFLRKALWEQVSEYAAYHDIPVHYLVTKDDRALKASTQQRIIDNIIADGGHVRVEEIKSGHSPMLAMPERTSDFIRRSAGEKIPQL